MAVRKCDVLNLEIDSNVKERAEFILEKLGIPMHVAIEVFVVDGGGRSIPAAKS